MRTKKSGLTKSKNNKFTEQLSNTKKCLKYHKTRPKWPTGLFPWKNSFTASNQVKNTLGEVRVSRSIIKRCLHECENSGFTTSCKPLITLKNKKDKLDRKHF